MARRRRQIDRTRACDAIAVGVVSVLGAAGLLAACLGVAVAIRTALDAFALR